MKIRYWTNAGTRYCSMTTGPIEESEMKRDGYVEVSSEAEMEEFRAITKKAKEAGDAAKATIEGGAPVLTFPIAGVPVKVRLNKLYEPEQVDLQAGAAVIGITYTEYEDLNDEAKADVFLPRRIVQKRAGATILDLTVANSNTNNPYVIMPVPPNVAKP